jgi:hypothetical protein
MTDELHPLFFEVMCDLMDIIYPIDPHQEATMVTRATGSQSTKTIPKAGQNKPQGGGAAGAGKDRGTAKLPTISRTTTPKQR